MDNPAAPEGSGRRRRRARPSPRTAPIEITPAAGATGSAAAKLPRPPDRDQSAKPPRGDSPMRDTDRSWRDLAGSSPSQVGVDGALRARDVARPTDRDNVDAEAEVAVVRRNWQPPAG